MATRAGGQVPHIGATGRRNTYAVTQATSSRKAFLRSVGLELFGEPASVVSPVYKISGAPATDTSGPAVAEIGPGAMLSR
jgi:hypothetical protein